MRCRAGRAATAARTASAASRCSRRASGLGPRSTSSRRAASLDGSRRAAWALARALMHRFTVKRRR